MPETTPRRDTTSRFGGNDIVITRVFDAPRELLWKAWTDPEMVKSWWGPQDYTAPTATVDLRKGGKYLFGMRAPPEQAGQDYYSTGVYTKIVPMERLEFTQSLADKEGNVITPAQAGMPADFPQEVRSVLTFEPVGDNKTRLTVTEYGWTAGQMRDYSIAGMNQSLEKLARVLGRKTGAAKKAVFTAPPGKQEITLTRVFDAPRDVVFKTYTDPNVIPLFWGPASLKTTVERMDLKPGGMWRYVQRDARGNEYAFHGFFHEVKPERMVYTFEFEGQPGDIMLEIADFIAEDGKTRVVSKDIFPSLEARDAAVKSGMEEGAVESMERFAGVLNKI